MKETHMNEATFVSKKRTKHMRSAMYVATGDSQYIQGQCVTAIKRDPAAEIRTCLTDVHLQCTCHRPCQTGRRRQRCKYHPKYSSPHHHTGHRLACFSPQRRYHCRQCWNSRHSDDIQLRADMANRHVRRTRAVIFDRTMISLLQ